MPPASLPSRSLVGALILGAAGLTGCASDRGSGAAGPFYAGNLAAARDTLRPLADDQKLDENAILNHARLGMAALADVDPIEARNTLRVAYQLTESGNVNDESRIFAATVLHEGVKVWKGEPFEQAMAYITLASAYATLGDWSNVRVAARATLRRLKDYSDARSGGSTTISQEELARRAARAEAERGEEEYDWFQDAGRFVESDFTLGYLLQAIADRQLGETTSMRDALTAAVTANPRVRPLADTIASGLYNTIILAAAGRGPTKVRTGTDGVFTTWIERDPGTPPPLDITIDGAASPAFAEPVTDVNAMSLDHRWITLENARQAKSILGTALLVGGGITAAASNDQTAQLIGLGAAVAGLILKASAAADVRHNELMPAAIYLLVLDVPPGSELRLTTPGGRIITMPDFRAPVEGPPRFIYLRLLPGGPPPRIPDPPSS